MLETLQHTCAAAETLKDGPLLKRYLFDNRSVAVLKQLVEDWHDTKIQQILQTTTCQEKKAFEI